MNLHLLTSGVRGLAPDGVPRGKAPWLFFHACKELQHCRKQQNLTEGAPFNRMPPAAWARHLRCLGHRRYEHAACPKGPPDE